MAIQSDVKLNNNHLILEGTHINTTAHDLTLDHSGRRGTRNKTRPRRALVHGFNDELVINYAGDYPGGVDVKGSVRIDNLIMGGKGNDGDAHLKDREGTTRVRISVDAFNSSPWPKWSGSGGYGSVELISEIRKMKEELLRLRAEVAKLKK